MHRSLSKFSKILHCLFYEYILKFLPNNYIINYLKYIYFEIDIRYYFEFDSIGNNGDQVHLLVGAEPT